MLRFFFSLSEEEKGLFLWYRDIIYRGVRRLAVGGGRYHWSLPVIKCQCLLPLNPPALWGLCLHGLAGGAQCESSPPRKESPLPSHLSPFTSIASIRWCLEMWYFLYLFPSIYKIWLTTVILCQKFAWFEYFQWLILSTLFSLTPDVERAKRKMFRILIKPLPGIEDLEVTAESTEELFEEIYNGNLTIQERSYKYLNECISSVSPNTPASYCPNIFDSEVCFRASPPNSTQTSPCPR